MDNDASAPDLDAPAANASTLQAPQVTSTFGNSTSTNSVPPGATVQLGLSQDEVNRIAAREAEKGKRTGKQEAKQEIAAALGVDLDTAKQIIEAAREREEAEKTEAQKAIDAALAEKEAAAQLRAELATERLQLSVERALLAAGISDDRQRVELVPLVAAKVEGDPTAESVAAAVEGVKSTFPQLFAAPTAALPPSGDPTRPSPPAPQGGPDAWTRGAERAKALQQPVSAFDPTTTLRL